MAESLPELQTDALCSVEEARLWIYRETTEVAADDLLPILINGVSDAVCGYTGRQFIPAEDAADKVFRYDGSGYLSLSPYEARAVTAVVLYSDLAAASWLTLTNQSASQEAEWRAEPRHRSRAGTFLWLTLPEVGEFAAVNADDLGIRRARGHQVTVTGDWGIGSVPGDVRLATLITVSHWYRNPEAFQSRNFAGEGIVDAVEEAEAWLPGAARGFLERYRRAGRGI